MNFTRIDNDINGNPRYAFHFTEIHNDYETALKIAKTIGGKKYNTKSFGGGICIQSYNIEKTEKDLIAAAADYALYIRNNYVLNLK